MHDDAVVVGRHPSRQGTTRLPPGASSRVEARAARTQLDRVAGRQAERTGLAAQPLEPGARRCVRSRAGRSPWRDEELPQRGQGARRGIVREGDRPRLLPRAGSHIRPEPQTRAREGQALWRRSRRSLAPRAGCAALTIVAELDVVDRLELPAFVKEGAVGVAHEPGALELVALEIEQRLIAEGRRERRVTNLAMVTARPSTAAAWPATTFPRVGGSMRLEILGVKAVLGLERRRLGDRRRHSVLRTASTGARSTRPGGSRPRRRGSRRPSAPARSVHGSAGRSTRPPRGRSRLPPSARTTRKRSGRRHEAHRRVRARRSPRATDGRSA